MNTHTSKLMTVGLLALGISEQSGGGASAPGAAAPGDRNEEFITPSVRTPDPALGREIALQGNAALVAIRSDLRRNLHQQKPTLPPTEFAGRSSPYHVAGTSTGVRLVVSP